MKNLKKRKPLLIGILAILVVINLAVGGTLAYLSDTDVVTNTFEVGEVDIDVDEPNYPFDDEHTPPPEVPGDSYEKDPTVTAVSGDSYMRLRLEFIDIKTGTQITDTGRINKILQTLYWDPDDVITLQPNQAVDINGVPLYLYDTDENITGSNPLSTGEMYTALSYHYTEAQLNAILGDLTITHPSFTATAPYTVEHFNNVDFEAPLKVNSDNTADFSTPSYAIDPMDGGVWFFLYKNTATDPDHILKEGVQATLFTKVIIPSDWNNDDLAILRGDTNPHWTNNANYAGPDGVFGTSPDDPDSADDRYITNYGDDGVPGGTGPDADTYGTINWTFGADALGEGYKIQIKAQAIQSGNFTGRNQAFQALNSQLPITPYGNS